jgi:hypothetical protein
MGEVRFFYLCLVVFFINTFIFFEQKITSISSNQENIILNRPERQHRSCRRWAQNFRNFFMSNKPSISFCIADIKFNDNTLKICEFGQGIFSTFRGYDSLHGRGKMWILAYEYLAQFKKPIWLVSQMVNKKNMADVAIEDLKKTGGNAFTSLLELQNDPIFQRAASLNSNICPRNISDFSGIVIVRKLSPFLQSFIQQYPNILVVDEKSSRFVGSKYETNILFKSSTHLLTYRPRFQICRKHEKTLPLEAIIKNIPAQYYVIKPVNSSMGKGIVMVEKNNLAHTLSIICRKNKDLPTTNEPTLEYWKHDKSSMFLVEEFVPSKPIYANDKWYDPTMRIAFIVSEDGNGTDMAFLDAYWKLPAKALTEEGTLTEKHKSHIVKGGQSSCLVSREDFAQVSKLLHPMLLAFFAKMESNCMLGSNNILRTLKINAVRSCCR